MDSNRLGLVQHVIHVLMVASNFDGEPSRQCRIGKTLHDDYLERLRAAFFSCRAEFCRD